MFASLIIFILALHSLLNFFNHHVPNIQDVWVFFIKHVNCESFEFQCWESMLFLSSHLSLGPHYRHEPECKPQTGGSRVVTQTL